MTLNKKSGFSGKIIALLRSKRGKNMSLSEVNQCELLVLYNNFCFVNNNFSFVAPEGRQQLFFTKVTIKMVVHVDAHLVV